MGVYHEGGGVVRLGWTLGVVGSILSVVVTFSCQAPNQNAM